MSRTRSRKAPKDPNQPKRPSTSYLLYTSERRDAVKLEHPGAKVTEISKYIGAEWGKLHADRKKEYQLLGQKLKAEWEVKMEAYRQTEAFAAHQKKLAIWKEEQKSAAPAPSRSKGRAKKQLAIKEPKRPKDKNAPKKPMTAYFLFSGDNRAAIKAKNPGFPVTLVAKELGAMWKVLGETEKTAYLEKAKVAKAAYNEVFAKYKETPQYEEFKKLLSAYNEEMKAYKKALKAAEAPSPPPSSKKKHRRREESSSESSSDSGSDSDSDDSSSSSGSSSDSSSGSYESSSDASH